MPMTPTEGYADPNLYEITIVNAITRLIISSPTILISLPLLFVSGNLWSYIILAYCSKKERGILCSKVGRMGLGLLWLAIASLPIYIINRNNLQKIAENFSESLFIIWLFALSSQAIIFIIINITQGIIKTKSSK